MDSVYPRFIDVKGCRQPFHYSQVSWVWSNITIRSCAELVIKNTTSRWSFILIYKLCKDSTGTKVWKLNHIYIYKDTSSESFGINYLRICIHTHVRNIICGNIIRLLYYIYENIVPITIILLWTTMKTRGNLKALKMGKGTYLLMLNNFINVILII